MTYLQAVHDLYALGHELHRIPPQKFDLAQMRVLAEALGHPERSFRAVLIAGTNGKGSTAATLASILSAAGYCTGLYTSPHLVRINERIRVNRSAISDDDFSGLYGRVRAVGQKLAEAGELPQLPSFFETLTAMAFLHFAELPAEIAILEVGMGGRLDATNIVEPLVSVITDIGLDHQKYLGDTIAQIAGEKAGILRPGVAAITLPQHPEANEVLGRRMMELGSRPVSAARNVAPLSPGAKALVQSSAGRTRFRLQVLGEEITVDSPLVGRHQLRNLALAITAAEELNALGFPLQAADVARGVRQTRWSGRFQAFSAGDRHPQLVLDVAHNPDGAWALRAALQDEFGERPRVFIFGAMRDKAVAEMAQILLPTAACVVPTTVSNPRAASIAEIAAAAEKTGTRILPGGDVRTALEVAFREAERLRGPSAEKPLVVVAGSIYVVGEAMQILAIEP